jgi:lysozyme
MGVFWAPVAVEQKPPGPPVLPLQSGDRGPDVASYQGYPDWAEVAAWGARFAFTKATEGTDYVNPSFTYNWERIRAVGLVRGAYHFARPDDNAPADEVDWFLTQVRDVAGSDLLVLDLEDGTGNLHDWCLAWLIRCQSSKGRKAVLYSGPSFMREHGLDAADVAAASGGLWLAAYTSTCPAVPRGFSEIMFWQYTDAERIDGIAGGADCSIYLP